jgi:hypothetical protein
MAMRIAEPRRVGHLIAMFLCISRVSSRSKRRRFTRCQTRLRIAITQTRESPATAIGHALVVVFFGVKLFQAFAVSR